MSQIHHTAIIEEGAKLGKNVKVGPYAVIGPHVRLDDDVEIKASVYLDGHTHIGQGSTIWPHAVIGTKTQDLKFRGEKTFVEIGKRCEIREFATINSSCGEGTSVLVGDQCLVMAYCHIAHNCVLGNRVIMVNNASLAGHVTIEDSAIIGGLSAVHQFSRIGAFAMVGGMSRITQDIPPYTIGAGSPYKIAGLNIVGLKRNGFSLHVRRLLAQAFRYVYRLGMPLEQALFMIERDLEQIPEVKRFVEFCKGSKRGLIDHAGVTGRSKDESSSEEDDEEEESLSGSSKCEK